MIQIAALLTAVLAEGVTELANAAIEPEIEDLICVLQKMGAIIAMDTDRTIRITGVDSLGGYNHKALPDRLEAASWASAALATEGDIYVRGAQQRSMMTFLNTFRKVGGAGDLDRHAARAIQRHVQCVGEAAQFGDELGARVRALDVSGPALRHDRQRVRGDGPVAA